MQDLQSRQAVDDALGEETVLVYKHSNRCPISAMAQVEVLRFLERHPEVPVYRVEVNRHRDLARYVAERTGIVHHSPQAILLHKGEPGWHGSHMEVTTRALERQVSLLRGRA